MFLHQCIDSLINQTRDISDVEILIIDDTSKDSSIEIIKNYQKKYPKIIRLILNDEWSRDTKKSNRNKGVLSAKGKYILFCDQDDWYEENTLERLESYIDQCPDIDYIEYNYINNYEATGVKEVKRGRVEDFHIYEIKNETDRIDLALEDILPGATFAWNKIYNRNFLIKNNIHHNELSQYTGFSDNFFSGLLVTHCTKFGKLDEAFYNYRIYKGSYSHDTAVNSKVQLERCKVANVYLQECKRRGTLKNNPEFIEYIYFRTYLLKTFWKFLLQYDPIPYEILMLMKSTICSQFCQYRKNVIMATKQELVLLFDILDQNWTEKYLDTLKIDMKKKIETDNKILKHLYLNNI